MATTIVAYLLAAMIAWCPPEVHYYHQSNSKTNEEKSSDTIERYESIAQDLSDVVMDVNQKPLFDGKDGRLKTALLELSIASFESGQFREDVDTITPTGDHGASYCLMQVHLYDGETIKDRKECFRIGLDRIRESRKMCSFLRPDERLAAYASGNCVVGLANSVRKIKRARSWLEEHPFFSLEE